MAINGGSLSSTSLPALSNSASVKLCSVPPGPCEIVVSNNCGQTVYIAAGVAASATNGFAIPNGAPPVTIRTYPGSTATTLNVIAGAAPTAGAPVSWLISSTQ